MDWPFATKQVRKYTDIKRNRISLKAQLIYTEEYSVVVFAHVQYYTQNTTVLPLKTDHVSLLRS